LKLNEIILFYISCCDVRFSAQHAVLISFSYCIWCCFPSRECRARCLGLRSPFSISAFFSVLGADLESSTVARCSARFFICRCSGLCLVSGASLPQLGQRASGFFDLTSVLVPLVLLFDFVSRCRVLAVAACSWSHKIFPCSCFCGRHRSEIRCAPTISLVTGQILSRSVLQGISSLGFSPALECRTAGVFFSVRS
jgi:hypothetical protein